MDSIVQCLIFLCLTTASFSTETANPDEDNISYHFISTKQHNQQGKTINLQCKIKVQAGFSLKWYKDEKLINIKDLENSNHYEEVEGENDSELIIKNPSEKDLGNYTCMLQEANNKSVEAHRNFFKILTELSVRMEPTVTVVEGEELKLRCHISSKSPPYLITWHLDTNNETYESSRDRVELKPDERNIANAILIIKEAMMEDRGTYTCSVFAVPTSSDAATIRQLESYVRVKDKLAALWPFLGICAEVFVLCAIILIYEKKRNQAELDESDTDQSPEQQKKSSAK